MNPRAPAELWTAATAAAADRHTIDVLGVPSPLLMERAALCVSHEVAARRTSGRGRVLVVAGPGNNGGDGVAVARQLHGWEIPVTVVLATESHNATMDEQIAIARGYGVTVTTRWPEGAPSVVVDALLGTGSRGAPRGGVAEALARMVGLAAVKIAVDIPSGIDPDSGVVHPDAFTADVTVTFARSKPGLHVTPGRGHAGRIVVADIGLIAPPDRERPVRLIDPTWIARGLPGASDAAHKGERGHVAVVGGSGGTPGAAVLSGAAALRAGAGLCTVATPDPEVRAQLVAMRPELMTVVFDDGPVVGAAGALVVGPGLTARIDAERLQALWRDDARPAVWDASALAHVPGPPPPTAGARILTPHPGEAASLLARLHPEGAWDTARVQADRRAAALRLAACTGAIVVLKGAGTVVALGDGTVAINPTGSAALATAGSGDVLAGLIAGLLAAGTAPGIAAQAGGYAHGLAGELVRPGATALDVADAIGPAVAELRQGTEHPRWPRLRRG